MVAVAGCASITLIPSFIQYSVVQRQRKNIAMHLTDNLCMLIMTPGRSMRNVMCVMQKGCDMRVWNVMSTAHRVAAHHNAVRFDRFRKFANRGANRNRRCYDACATLLVVRSFVDITTTFFFNWKWIVEFVVARAAEVRQSADRGYSSGTMKCVWGCWWSDTTAVRRGFFDVCY